MHNKLCRWILYLLSGHTEGWLIAYEKIYVGRLTYIDTQSHWIIFAYNSEGEQSNLLHDILNPRDALVLIHPVYRFLSISGKQLVLAPFDCEKLAIKFLW